MRFQFFKSYCFCLMLFLLPSHIVFAQDLQEISLPEPQKTGGMPIMEAFENRKSTREYSARKLPVETVSGLLWSAFGINRHDGKRTAPSAMNWRETEIYVVTADTTYLYAPENHALVPHSSGDLRSFTGMQDFVSSAPLNLVYVADLSKMGDSERNIKERLAMADTGFISQNVYLYCASEGLGTVVRGWIDKPALSEALKLGDNHFITLAQTIGYPKE